MSIDWNTRPLEERDWNTWSLAELQQILAEGRLRLSGGSDNHGPIDGLPFQSPFHTRLLILSRGEGVDIEDKGGWTPLMHIANYYGPYRRRFESGALWEDDASVHPELFLDLFDDLVAHDADVDRRAQPTDGQGDYDVLDLALAGRDPEIVRRVARAGRDLNRPHKGALPLHRAVMTYESVGVVRCLVEEGADPGLKTETMAAPCDYGMAVENGEISAFFDKWIANRDSRIMLAHDPELQSGGKHEVSP